MREEYKKKDEGLLGLTQRELLLLAEKKYLAMCDQQHTKLDTDNKESPDLHCSALTNGDRSVIR
jgi:hypothetical protein